MSRLRIDSADPAAPPVRYEAHRTDTLAAATTPDGGTLATGSDDRIVQLWRIAADGRPSPTVRLVRHGDRITSLTFSPDGRWLASGSEDRTVILWDVSRGEEVGRPIPLPVGPAVAFSSGAADGPGPHLAVAGAGLYRWPMWQQAWVDIACRALHGRALDEAERQRYLRGTTPVARCP